MSNATLEKYRWFWAWDDEKEEAWLRQMSQAGWHFQRVRFPGRYVFAAGEPCDYVYRMDFNTVARDYQHYLQLFRDAGWTHLGVYGNWQYFRIEARAGDDPQIFTDNASKIAKYQRVMLALTPFIAMWTIFMPRMARNAIPLFQAFSFIAFLLYLVFIFAIIMLARRIGQLKKMQK